MGESKLIIGTGIDIVEIDRIEKALNKGEEFLHKIFNKSEIEYLERRNMRPEYVAGRFAAKEAVAKALGTGFRGFDFKDIIIEKTALGKPIVSLRGNAKLIAKKNGDFKIHLSISHSNRDAIAYAVLEVLSNEDRDIHINKGD